MALSNVIFCILVGSVATLASADPCTSYSELPRAQYRGGQCTFNNEKPVCDRTLTSGWYRAVGTNGDLQIQEANAEFETCGTKFPFWMNGTHPTVADGEVIRDVCMSSLMSYCDSSQQISVKNCNGFYVYKLESTGFCPSGYCFGQTEGCPPFDPCDVYENDKVDYDPGRSSICNQHGDTNCDSFDSNTWYSFRDPLFGYLNMTTQCPMEMDACGSQLALFIDVTNSGTADADGSLETEVCEQDYPTCCSRRFNIRSKECNGFMVYKFPSPPSGTCHRYCLDDRTATCPTTTTTTTTTTTDKVTSQADPNMTTSTGNNDDPAPKEHYPDKGIKDYIWVIAVVVCIAVITVVAVAVLVIRFMPKHRSMVDLAEKPPPYTKEVQVDTKKVPHHI